MKNDNHNQQARHASGGTCGAPARGKGALRLVYSARPSTGVTPAVIPVGSSFARFISLRPLRGPKDAVSQSMHDYRRLEVRRKEGRKMKTIERVIHAIGRFAVGLGSVLALVCTFVIVTSDHALGLTEVTQPAEVVRLDPVVVTISAERFDAIRAEAQGPSRLVRTPGRKTNEG